MNEKLNNGANELLRVAALDQEIVNWKQKYEALGKLYAQLRKEHLDLLGKLKQMKDNETLGRKEDLSKIDDLIQSLQSKSEELMSALGEKAKLKQELLESTTRHDLETTRLKGLLDQSNKKIQDLSASRGTEVESLVRKFTTERDLIEQELKLKSNSLYQLGIDFNDLKTKRDRVPKVLP